MFWICICIGHFSHSQPDTRTDLDNIFILKDHVHGVFLYPSPVYKQVICRKPEFYFLFPASSDAASTSDAVQLALFDSFKGFGVMFDPALLWEKQVISDIKNAPPPQFLSSLS